jgi:hypothetical protein
LSIEVQQGINAAPGYINIQPPKVKVSGGGGGLQSMFGNMSKKVTPGDEENPSPLVNEIEQSKPSALNTIETKVRPIDVEATEASRLVQDDVQHAMAPVPNPLNAKVEGVAVAEVEDDAVVDVKAEGEAVASTVLNSSGELLVQTQMLNGISQALNAAVSVTGFYMYLHNTMSVLESVLELALNATIMLASSNIIESDASEKVTSICAAANAVLKGLDMKVQFEVKTAEVKVAYQKFKALQEKVNSAKLELDARKQPIFEKEFADLRDHFHDIVTTYASWLPPSV